MAFCTGCGANVTGAFCNQCGKPVAASAAPAPPPAGFTAAPPPPAGPGIPMGSMPPPPAARKTSPLVWILVAIGGVFVLFLIGMLALGGLIVHTAHKAGLDTDLMRRNPAAAVARMAAMANKDVDIVSEDDNAGTITMRDHKTGKTITMSFNDMKNGIRFSADDENGKTATMEFGGGDAKLPSWVPIYPGASRSQSTFSVRGSDANGAGEGGNFTFTTSDPPSKVMDYYSDKAKEMGLKVNVTTTTSEGGMIVASEQPSGKSLSVIVGSDHDKTTVNVTYGDKK